MEAHAKIFSEAFHRFNTLELTWLFNMASEQAKEAIERAEMNHIRHKAMGREKPAAEALERIPFYEKVIDLRNKWRDAEVEMSAPQILEALGYKPKSPPRKKV